MYHFENRTVWVTGSGTGIGRALALAFARHGADVIVHVNSSIDKSNETAKLISDMGRQSMVVTGNVGKRSEVERMAEQIAAKFERLDVLINNAGSLIRRSRLVDMDEALWDEVMAVNLKSVYLVTKAVFPLLKKAPKARVINMTSIAARTGGGYGSMAYSAAKAGVSALTRGMAKDLVEYGMTVNGIAPGVIATPFHDRFTPPELRTQTVGTIPMGREGQPEEVAGAALFLASPYADYITGEIIEVNGGQLMD